jgi:hypothetical protein
MAAFAKSWRRSTSKIAKDGSDRPGHLGNDQGPLLFEDVFLIGFEDKDFDVFN